MTHARTTITLDQPCSLHVSEINTKRRQIAIWFETGKYSGFRLELPAEVWAQINLLTSEAMADMNSTMLKNVLEEMGA